MSSTIKSKKINLKNESSDGVDKSKNKLKDKLDYLNENLSDSNKILLEKIEQLLLKTVDEIKLDNKNSLEILKSNFERKIDIIANIESVNKTKQNLEDSKQSTKSVIKTKTVNITPLSFLQNKIKNEGPEVYLDKLYSKEELDEVKKLDELCKKNKEGTVLYKRKLASLLFSQYIKNNSEKLEKLNQYKDSETIEE